MHVAHAVRSWRNCVMALPVTEHPKLWVGHYTDRLVGSTWAPKITGELVLILGSPFAASNITATIIICDLLSELAISRLMWDGKGVREHHWVAPYQRADDGNIRFSLAMPEQPVPYVRRAVQALSEQRLMGNQYDFELRSVMQSNKEKSCCEHHHLDLVRYQCRICSRCLVGFETSRCPGG